ncbi:MAG: PepSY domain-containing protein [Pseudomonadota bacterium]
MILKAVIRRIHLWAGVLLGIQMILWMLSGVVMTWYHIGDVRGSQNAPTVALPELEATAYASPGGVIAQMDGVYSVELRYFLGRPVYEVSSAEGVALFRAEDGALISPISEDDVRKVANAGFVGDGAIASLDLLTVDPGIEYRGAGVLPVWRAQFNDRLNTRLYISPNTGAILRRRNDIWRFYDFFWMLHIMDYGERSDFNNPLVKVASAGGLMFALSGFIMLFFRHSWSTLKNDLSALTGQRKENAREI